jgi:hypothetical protein
VNEEWFRVWGCWCQLFIVKGKVALCYLLSNDVYGHLKKIGDGVKKLCVCCFLWVLDMVHVCLVF